MLYGMLMRTLVKFPNNPSRSISTATAVRLAGIIKG